MPRDSDGVCSKWEDVAVGSITAASIAKWMMAAQQKSIQATIGGPPVPFATEILDAEVRSGADAGAGSELRWHASVSIPAAVANGETIEGTSGRAIPLAELVAQAGPSSSPPRVTAGKALLRAGVVVFVSVDAPKMRFEVDYPGDRGREFLDAVAQSLQLTVPGGL